MKGGGGWEWGGNSALISSKTTLFCSQRRGSGRTAVTFCSRSKVAFHLSLLSA